MRDSRWRWLIGITILLLGFGLRLALVAYDLPYIHNPDASNFYLLANDWRGELPAGWRADWLAGYPPGYIVFYGVILNGVDAISKLNIHTDMSVYVGIMRLVSVLLDTVTLALVMTLAGWLGGNVARLMSGSVYAVSPSLIFVAPQAMPDPLTTVLVMATAICGWQALHRDDGRFALLATLWALLAVIVKYPAAPILLIPALYYLRALWTRRIAALPESAFALLLVLSVAYLLWVVYGAGQLENAESVRFRSSLLDSLLAPQQWYIVLTTFGRVLSVPFLLIGALSLPVALMRRRRKVWGVGVLLLAGTLLLVMVVAYVSKQRYPVRYIWGGAALWIVALSAIYSLAWREHRWRWFVACVPALLLLPMTTAQVREYQQPMTFTAIQPWFEANVPDESVLWMEDFMVYRSLSRYEAGYSGYKNFGLMYANEYPDATAVPAEADYIYMHEQSRAAWSAKSGWQPLSTYGLVKHISSAGRHGVGLYVYSTDPLAAVDERTALFGEQLALYGVDMRYDVASRTLTVPSYWRAQPPVQQDYSYVLYLTPPDDPTQILAQQDAPLGQRRTSTWNDPDELLRGEIAPFTLPADITAGDYAVWLGVYYWQTGERLLLQNETPALRLGELSLP